MERRRVWRSNGGMAFDASSLPWSETVSRAFPSRAMTAAGSPRHADAGGRSIEVPLDL